MKKNQSAVKQESKAIFKTITVEIDAALYDRLTEFLRREYEIPYDHSTFACQCVESEIKRVTQ
jgi:hypothetical protein